MLVGGRSAGPWVTAGDRGLSPVVARMWHAVWMQTTGAPCSRSTVQLARTWMPAQAAIARMGCCTWLLYGPTLASKNTVKTTVTSGDLGGTRLNSKYTFEMSSSDRATVLAQGGGRSPRSDIARRRRLLDDMFRDGSKDDPVRHNVPRRCWSTSPAGSPPTSGNSRAR